MFEVEIADPPKNVDSISVAKAGSIADVSVPTDAPTRFSRIAAIRGSSLTPATRYLCIWTAIVVAMLVTAAIFNTLVDPYDVVGSIRVPGFNFVKPEAENRVRLTKPYQIGRLQPRAVIVGTSRAEIGLDPENSSWPEAVRPVYNFGLPGANLATVNRELQVAGSSGRLKLAVILLDFENFLSSDPDPDLTPDENQRMAVGAGSQPTVPTARRLKDTFLTTLTLTALEDSVLTVLRQHGRYATDITPTGKWTEAAFQLAAASDGYYELFTQKEVDYARRAARAASFLADGADATLEIEIVRQMLDYCRAHGVRPILVIPPYHADLLEMFDKAGLWDRFEAWKIGLVKLVYGSLDSREVTGQLWDFSGYDRYSTEPVPEKGDRHTTVNWFWEPGHFKRALGDLLLKRVLDNEPSDFGVELTSATIDEQLKKIRLARENYRITRETQIARVDDIYLQAQKRY